MKCPSHRDFLGFSVVFIVSLVWGAEEAIAAGVALSWFLSIARPHFTRCPVRGVVIHPSRDDLHGAPVIKDLCDSEDTEFTCSGRVAVLSFQSPLLFSTADKFKVSPNCLFFVLVHPCHESVRLFSRVLVRF
jgi:MFS superfamily sulfate permease-like transporter